VIFIVFGFGTQDVQEMKEKWDGDGLIKALGYKKSFLKSCVVMLPRSEGRLLFAFARYLIAMITVDILYNEACEHTRRQYSMSRTSLQKRALTPSLTRSTSPPKNRLSSSTLSDHRRSGSTAKTSNLKRNNDRGMFGTRVVCTTTRGRCTLPRRRNS
jgi:hypothetical protein